MTIPSFTEFRQGLSALPAFDQAAAERARQRQESLTKPAGSLGKLEEIAIRLAGWQGREIPLITQPQAVIFAGNHGVAARGVSAYPSSVTAQMVANFEAGGAAINQLCALQGIGLSVVPLSLDKPTQDFTQSAAMTEDECMDAMRTGMESIPPACDLLLPGEMGIGNTASASAIVCALLNRSALEMTGPGTGLIPAQVQQKAAVIEEGLARHRALLADPLEVLRCLGGREIAAITGALLAARRRRIPVLLDGFVVSAAAAVLHSLTPDAVAHCLAGHISAEPAHRIVLTHLGLPPLLDLNMRLGEGSGAAVAYGIVQASLAAHRGMATFESAGVSGKN